MWRILFLRKNKRGDFVADIFRIQDHSHHTWGTFTGVSIQPCARISIIILKKTFPIFDRWNRCIVVLFQLLLLFLLCLIPPNLHNLSLRIKCLIYPLIFHIFLQQFFRYNLFQSWPILQRWIFPLLLPSLSPIIIISRHIS